MDQKAIAEIRKRASPPGLKVAGRPTWAEVRRLLADLEAARRALQPFADAWRTYGWRADGTPKYGPEMNPEWLRRAAEAGGQA